MANKKIIIGGNVFTGEEDFLETGLAVLIENKTIIQVGPEDELLSRNDDAEIIDAKGGTVMSGMIDCHRHIIALSGREATTDLITEGTLFGTIEARQAVHQGITTVRDPGCKHMGIFSFKKFVDNGRIPGPSIYAAGPNPASSSAPQTWRNIFADGESEVRKAVRFLYSSGANWIKLVVSQATPESGWSEFVQFYSLEELTAAVEEAHALGLKVSGHIEGDLAVQNVVKAGFDAIEHGIDFSDETIKKMIEKNVIYVPTLIWSQGKLDNGFVPEEKKPDFRIRIKKHRDAARRAISAGVMVATGTDSPTTISAPWCLVDEAVLLHEYGLSIPETLRALTLNGAKLIGIDDHVGKIAAGYDADIIIVHANPFDNLENLKNLDLVIKHGKIIER